MSADAWDDANQSAIVFTIRGAVRQSLPTQVRAALSKVRLNRVKQLAGREKASQAANIPHRRRISGSSTRSSCRVKSTAFARDAIVPA